MTDTKTVLEKWQQMLAIEDKAFIVIAYHKSQMHEVVDALAVSQARVEALERAIVLVTAERDALASEVLILIGDVRPDDL
jgi:hypothetical protein